MTQVEKTFHDDLDEIIKGRVAMSIHQALYQARGAGYIVDVQLQPLLPLSMGHHQQVVGLRKIRSTNPHVQTQECEHPPGCTHCNYCGFDLEPKPVIPLPPKAIGVEAQYGLGWNACVDTMLDALSKLGCTAGKLDTQATTAIATLKEAGYTYHEAGYWEPPKPLWDTPKQN